ncbi:MAG: 4Fe-4S binding protein [Oscillospiraceae bacterium]|nr:4Fe-4S binding protein [Oscillospiraceae bacterium]
MKRYKKEENGKLEIGQVMYTKTFTLTVDRALCKGCQLCRLACPHHAIRLIPQEDVDGKAVAPLLDVDENTCDFHGICAVVCPFSAITITVGGLNESPAVAKGAFPELARDIAVCNESCVPGCTKCEEACPLGVLSVNTEAGEVAVKKELCAGCPACWMACPEDAVEVSKFIEGTIQINDELCPADCKRCLDVCPVNALALDENGKVLAKELLCIYCGACKEVCPVSGALKVTRSAIRHTPVNSGAWHKGLERLTSKAALQRELAAGNAARARTAVQNLETEVNA